MKQFIKYIIICTIISATSAGPVVGADLSTFDIKVAEILANNPTLASRRASAQAETLNAKAENNLSDPEVEFEHQWGHPSVGGNKWSVSVSQSFDWPGVYNSRRKSANAQAQAFRLLYLAEESDMRLRIGYVLTDYIAARKQLVLSQKTSDNLTEIAKKISKSFNCGEATIIDYRKAEFERVQALSRTDAAQTLVDNLKSELIELNGGKYINLDSLYDFPRFELQSEEFYLERHESYDPAILAGSYLIEAAAQNTKTATRSSYPGFSLGYIHNVELGDHFNGIKAGVTIPLFSNRHRRASAKFQEEAARQQANEVFLAVNRRVISEYTEAKKLTSRIADYAGLFPDTEKESDYLTLLRKSFDGGQMPLIVYLYELNYYNEASSAYIALQQSQALILLSLSRFNNN